MTGRSKTSYPRGNVDPIPAEIHPHFNPDTGALDLIGMDADFAELEGIDAEIAAISTQIATLTNERDSLKAHAAEIAERLTGSASAYGAQVENGPYLIRYTPGRASTSWDAAQLEKVLPDDLKAVVMTYTPKADMPLLNQLERSGKLPPEALEAKTVKPAQPRYILERKG